MLEAILFDLDGTLLDIDMEYFLSRYFKEMGRMAQSQGIVAAGRLVNQILKSTDIMINDNKSEKNNEEKFMRHFFSHMEVDERKMRDFFDEFYRSGFPRLSQYCQPFPGIPEMMTKAFESGYKIVIATNAVFPRTAIQSRLEWAGIGQFPYNLVTSYENMHYCKPFPQYYKEIADKIDTPPTACLMVGNDTGEDLAAGEIGMKTFLVENCLIDRGNSPYSPDWRGRMQDLFSFVDGLVNCGTG